MPEVRWFVSPSLVYGCQEIQTKLTDPAGTGMSCFTAPQRWCPPCLDVDASPSSSMVRRLAGFTAGAVSTFRGPKNATRGAAVGVAVPDTELSSVCQGWEAPACITDLCWGFKPWGPQWRLESCPPADALLPAYHTALITINFGLCETVTVPERRSYSLFSLLCQIAFGNAVFKHILYIVKMLITSTACVAELERLWNVQEGPIWNI